MSWGETKASICSQGSEIDYYSWSARKSEGQTKHIDMTVDELVQAVMSDPNNHWGGPYQGIRARGRFTSVLRMACAGQLHVPDEVKSIDGAHPASLFEMRWNDISIIRVRDGSRRHDEALVRLFYGEPLEPGVVAVGLLAWEKPKFSPRNRENQRKTTEAQESAITVAVDRYWQGATTAWGFR